MPRSFLHIRSGIQMVKVGIVGGTGYTGVELIRLLVGHPQAEIVLITSRSEQGRAVADLFPSLRGKVDLQFEAPDSGRYAECDVVFFATPNGIAMQQVDAIMEQDVRVIDLAADFRIKDLDEWSRWYSDQHACPDRVEQAVYGLPEMNREQIRKAELIANPGCYVTAVTLGLLPLLENDLIVADDIIADCKSGVSGAGRSANLATAFCEATESVKAYAVSGHRHYPEIRQNLRQVNDQADLVFIPHLMPMIRGIHATLYVRPKSNIDQVQEVFVKHYQDAPFVNILPAGMAPETRSVKGSNYCQIALQPVADGSRLVVLSVIDNLVKGAAGQAVQNMNLMMGLDEVTGLESVGLMP